MIICRTPLRISFFGGSTDYPEWFKKKKSVVINSTINKYTYIVLRKIKKIHNYKYRLRYFKNEETKSVDKIKHGPYREIIKKMNLSDQPLEIVYTADLPAMSGLGSSSSSTVGMINAATALNNNIIGKKKLAKDAIFIEREKLRENVGYQDQIASAFGGFNKISLNSNNFLVESFNNFKNLKILNDHCFLYFTGLQRISSKIEKEKISQIKNSIKIKNYENIYDIAEEAVKELNKKKFSIKNIGRLLGEQWNIKKDLTQKVSNPKIENIYKFVIKNGAYGGKLLGAGGGGFILFLCNPQTKNKIKSKLKANNIVDFKFEFSGSQIIYNGNYTELNY